MNDPSNLEFEDDMQDREEVNKTIPAQTDAKRAVSSEDGAKCSDFPLSPKPEQNLIEEEKKDLLVCVKCGRKFTYSTDGRCFKSCGGTLKKQNG